MYKIVRKWYKTNKDIESDNYHRIYEHDYFDPMTLNEAKIVKSKLCTPIDAIDLIVEIK